MKSDVRIIDILVNISLDGHIGEYFPWRVIVEIYIDDWWIAHQSPIYAGFCNIYSAPEKRTDSMDAYIILI